MKVCVLGLWHLGTVTAACLAAGGHDVVGLDFDATTVQQLKAGQPPLYEPGLEELLQQGLAEGRLAFSTDVSKVDGREVVWVAYDTPVDDEDRADVEFVIKRVKLLFPHLAAGTLLLISSQVPVGTTRRLEEAYQVGCPEKPVTFAYSPENLRLGKAISVFTKPDRVVVGVRNELDRARVAELLRPFTERIEWMSVESAEMTKHALNGFLATSISFINEVATLCQQVGADAKEVERGLKSDARIGPRAYLAPGTAFAGGTLARDLVFLTELGANYSQPTHLLSGARASNEAHKKWIPRQLHSFVGDLQGKRITIWGLTYKPGTDTLRRSSSVELCEWLVEQGAQVQAHDPAVKVLPEELAQRLTLHATPLAALEESVALVVATEWPLYQSVSAESVVSAMRSPLVIDPKRFLVKTLGSNAQIQYMTIGFATPPWG